MLTHIICSVFPQEPNQEPVPLSQEPNRSRFPVGYDLHENYIMKKIP